MRNKKSLLSLGMLAIVLVLGVGYAVIQEVGLSITGTAAAPTEDIAVAFTDVQIADEYKDFFNMEENATSIGDGLTAKIAAKDLVLNQPVEITYVITNNETDVSAKVTPGEIGNTNTEYFSVTTNFTAEDTLAPGQPKNVVVTITLNKTPVVSENNSTTITIPFTATAVNNANTPEAGE